VFLRFSFAVSLFCLSLFAESSSHKIKEVSKLETELNRVRTRVEWESNPIQFPCAELIKEKQAEAKKNKKRLPGITIHGERHDDKYCGERREVLERSSAKHICMASEYFNAPADKSVDPKPIKGLENPDIKLLTGLLVAYEAFSSPPPPTASPELAYGLTVGAAMLYGDEVYLALKLAQEDFSEVGNAARALLPSLERARDIFKEVPPENVPKQDEEEFVLKETARQEESIALDKEILAIADRERKALATIFPDLIREITAKVIARSEGGKQRESVALPKELKAEIEYSLRAIQKAAASPKSLTCQKEASECFAYRVNWRDHLMAFNLAQAYCDNLGSEKPKSLHAVVGAFHKDPMMGALEQSAKDLGIELEGDQGTDHTPTYQTVIGSPGAKGLYPDQPVRLESVEGKEIGLSMQKEGLRFFFMTDKFDPLGGTTISHPSPKAGSPVLKVLGPPETLDAFFYKTLGKRPDRDPNMMGDWLKAKEGMMEEMKRLYAGATDSVKTLEWPKAKPKGVTLEDLKGLGLERFQIEP